MKSNLPFHIFLFVLTFLTLTFREGIFFVFDPNNRLWEMFQSEVFYSIPLLLILLAHEMGHYIPSRIHGIRATLPYFIPMPFGPIGTMGAVIKIEDQFPSKSQLFDVGFGGPFMSLILSIPCWIIGLHFSELTPIVGIPHTNEILIFGDSLFTKWSAQWILGPFDPNIMDVMIHPLARAGWVGLLITAINMLPFGQLDGGHIIYSVFGEKYRTWIHYLFFCFLFLGLINITWVIWGFLIYFLIKLEHPFVPDSNYPLDQVRKFLGYFILFSFIFIFIPVPLTTLKEIHNPTLFDDIINFFNRIAK